MSNKIFLASNSSRRRALLEQIGACFQVISPGEVELNNSTFPVELVINNAYSKVMAAASKLLKGVIVGADTVIVIEEKILGKPSDVSEARKFLKFLSGQTHSVLTGVSVYDVGAQKIKKFSKETKVKFRKLDESEIEKYLSTGEWEGKAGAYAIQGKGSLFVESIYGCFYNVVGLPLTELYEVLREFEINLG